MPAYETLSEREIDVSLLVVAGKSQAQIAQELRLPLDEVNALERGLLAKLGCDYRTQAALVWCMQDAEQHSSVERLQAENRLLTMQLRALRERCRDLQAMVEGMRL